MAQSPQLLFEREVVATNGWVEKPVVANNMILLAGGSYCLDCRSIPVLQALDAQTGRQRFLIDMPVYPQQELVTSLPLIDPRGVILLVVCKHQESFQVLHIAPDGALLEVDDLGTDYPLVAYDVACKLMVRAQWATDQAYLVSWCYRQRRSYGMHYRQLRQPTPAWESPEWLLATTAHEVIGATRPTPFSGQRHDLLSRLEPDDAQIVCRDKRSGEVLWRQDAPQRYSHVAGVQGDVLLLIDRTARFQRHIQRRNAADEAFAMGTLGEAAWEAEWSSFPDAPTTLRALSARSGVAAWSSELPGDLVSLATCTAGVSALVSDPNGRGAIFHFDLEGQMVGHIPMVGRRLARWPDAEHGLYAIARTESRLLWANNDHIFCHAIGQSEEPLWSLPLPAPCAGFDPRICDRGLTQTNATYVDGKLYLRSGGRLWAYAIPD